MFLLINFCVLMVIPIFLDCFIIVPRKYISMLLGINAIEKIIDLFDIDRYIFFYIVLST